MAIKDVLTHLDFKKVNELRNVLFHKLSSAPSEPTEGQTYYNTTDHRLYVWNATAWVGADSASITAGDALTRTGDDLNVIPGFGLDISSDTIRIAAAAAGNGLSGGAGSALAVSTGAGLEISSDAVRIAAAAAGAGLVGGAGSALAVGDGSGITVNADDIAVNVGAGLEIASDAVRIAAAAAGAGLVGGAGSALAVGAGTGITVNADDVAVNTAVIATKAFAEELINNVDNKASVRAATTANITIATALNAGDVIDGVTLANGDRVLVKDQTLKKENGIYVVAASPARATDADISAEVTAGLFTFVGKGTVNANSGWQLFTDDPIVLGTTELVFEQITGAGQITAGAGLTKTGNVLNIGEGNGIKVEADEIKIDKAVVVRKYAAAFGDGASTEYEITHGLETEDVTVEIYRNSGNKDTVECEVRRVSATKIKLIFNTAPTSNQFRVVVQG